MLGSSNSAKADLRVAMILSAAVMKELFPRGCLVLAFLAGTRYCDVRHLRIVRGPIAACEVEPRESFGLGFGAWRRPISD